MSGKICFIQLEEYIMGRIFLWKGIIHFDGRRVFKNDLGFICFKSKTWKAWDLETSFYILLSFRSVPLLLPAPLAHISLWSPCLNTAYGSNTLFPAPVLTMSHETHASCFTLIRGILFLHANPFIPCIFVIKCHKLYWFSNCFTLSSLEFKRDLKF